MGRLEFVSRKGQESRNGGVSRLHSDMAGGESRVDSELGRGVIRWGPDVELEDPHV